MTEMHPQTNVEINPTWREIFHRQQALGWCAAAVIHLILLYSNQIKESDKQIVPLPTEVEIYALTNIAWFGVANGIAAAYLSRFFSEVGQKTCATIEEMCELIQKKYIIVVDWMDDSPPPPPEGHYCIVAGFNREKNTLTLVDTSRCGREIWECSVAEFERKWFDYEGMQNQDGLKISQWMLWINPETFQADSLGTEG